MSLAGEENIFSAVRSLGLGYSGEGNFLLSTIADWAARGTETYTYVFSLSQQSCAPRNFLLKAFVPFPGTVTVAAAMERHLANGRLLEEAGGMVPHVYASGEGTILCDYISDDAFVHLGSLEVGTEPWVRIGRGILGSRRAVHAAGFAPADGDIDVRTDGRTVYVVDLGEDLGTVGCESKGAASPIAEWAWFRRRLAVAGVNNETVEGLWPEVWKVMVGSETDIYWQE